jgi:enoyl-CoA hydratase
VSRSYRTLETERRGSVLTVRVNHPPRNLFDELVCADLEHLVKRIEADPAVRAVVITGRPDQVFMTRYDTREMLRDTGAFFRPVSVRQARALLGTIGALRRVPGVQRLLLKTPLRALINLHRINTTFRRMNRMDKAFIAAINGMAVGGGLLLPLACDLRLVADDAGPIGLPEPAIGLVPAIGGTYRATRWLGPARSLALMLEGRQMTPAEALELGLVHHVVPRGQLLDEALTRAEHLATFPPGIVGIIKRLVYEGASRRIKSATAMEGAGIVASLSTRRTREVVEAFTARLNGPAESDEDQITAYRLALEGKLGPAR